MSTPTASFVDLNQTEVAMSEAYQKAKILFLGIQGICRKCQNLFGIDITHKTKIELNNPIKKLAYITYGQDPIAEISIKWSNRSPDDELEIYIKGAGEYSDMRDISLKEAIYVFGAKPIAELLEKIKAKVEKTYSKVCSNFKTQIDSQGS